MTDQPLITRVTWSGCLMAVQPRIRLTRSFDERYHSYDGYVLCVEGLIGGQLGEALIAVGKAAHKKHGFCVGMCAIGTSVAVEDTRLETAAYYKTSGISIELAHALDPISPPPFHGVPPDLEVYRSRGHRRLAPRTFDSSCSTCLWGCRMPVQIILDHWNPSVKRYRFETFCYGPKNCTLYRPGPTRKVPGRNGMSWEEEDWVDEEATANRPPDQ